MDHVPRELSRQPGPVTHVERHVVEAVPDLPEPGLVPERVQAVAEDEQVVGELPSENRRRRIGSDPAQQPTKTSDRSMCVTAP